MSRKVYIVRGLPGSGKSTMVKKIVDESQNKNVVVASADDFFLSPCCGKYCFQVDKLPQAHSWCKNKFLTAVAKGTDVVIVDNTNVTASECRYYVTMGVEYGYDIEFVEPSTPWAFDVDQLVQKNVHGVPREVIQRMLGRWQPNMTIQEALSRDLH